MRYDRFEDLPVWKAAIDLAHRVYALIRDGYLQKSGDLSSQLRRASLSVSNSIAEGFERGSTADLISFLYIARGSAGEVRSMLLFVEGDPLATHLKSQISDLKLKAENCSKQLRGWADHLQNSDIKGQRHLEEKARKSFEIKQRAEIFEKHLDEVLGKAQSRPNPGPIQAQSRPNPSLEQEISAGVESIPRSDPQ